MEYHDICKLAKMIFESSGCRVRVDQFYARRGTTIHRSAILSEFTKDEIVNILANKIESQEDDDLVDAFINNTLQESIENDYIIS